MEPSALGLLSLERRGSSLALDGRKNSLNVSLDNRRSTVERPTKPGYWLLEIN
jgi:hypothetical protein